MQAVLTSRSNGHERKRLDVLKLRLVRYNVSQPCDKKPKSTSCSLEYASNQKRS
jgi:hypothetical protein